MKKLSKFKLIIGSLITVTVISGAVTYIMTDKKNKVEKPYPNEEESIEISQKAEDPEDVKKEGFNIQEIFNGVENIYIKNLNNPTNMVEVDGRDRAFIIASFKGFEKEKADEKGFRTTVYDMDAYKYEIDIIEQNAKIKFYPEAGYIVIDIKDQVEGVYKIPKNDLINFVDTLEEAYINGQLSKILYPMPKKIYLNAEDENSFYVMNKNEVKEFISKLSILSIENSEDYGNVPAKYPDYDVVIKRDDHEYKFHIINENTIIVDTPIVYMYCKYDKGLWKFISEKLPMKNIPKDNEIAYLLRSEKVVVKDTEGVYDFQDSKYYNIEIPRNIIKSEYEKVADNSINEELRFSLKFFVKNEIKEVSIYDNYFKYGDQLYFSKNVGESIKSLLMIF